MSFLGVHHADSIGREPCLPVRIYPRSLSHLLTLPFVRTLFTSTQGALQINIPFAVLIASSSVGLVTDSQPPPDTLAVEDYASLKN